MECQQRLLLRGGEARLVHLNQVLQDIKQAAGLTTVGTLMAAIAEWESDEISDTKQEIRENIRIDDGRPSLLQLPLFCPADTYLEISRKLDTVWNDRAISKILNDVGVKKDNWLLEALILILEHFANSERFRSIDTIVSADGVRCAVLPPKVPANNQRRCSADVLNSRRLSSGVVTSLASFRHGARRTSSSRNSENTPESRRKASASRRRSSVRQDEDQIINFIKLGSRSHKDSVTGLENGCLRGSSTTEKRLNSLTSIVNNKENFANDKKSRDLDNIGNGGWRTKFWEECNEEDVKQTRSEEKEDKTAEVRRGSLPKAGKKVEIIQMKAAQPLRTKYNLESLELVPLSGPERREMAAQLGMYLTIITPDDRQLPGFQGIQGKWDRHRLGVDCDEVFPNLFLGNGATVRKKEYLAQLGVSHILNAAEFRGVNVNEDYYADDFTYKGIRIEDTPQTQICRYFFDVAEYLDSALSSQTGKIFVNCVFGRSRSATCVAAYLMLRHDWDAITALKHIRMRRPIQVNDGFLQQLADFDYKLKRCRNQWA